MFHKTKHEDDCGNCKHWKQWDFARELAYWKKSNEMFKTQIEHDKDSLHFGDCNKIAEGTPYTLDDGETCTFDGYIFEDEYYDDVFHCFEARNDGQQADS